jgi:hypothetical protein
MFPVLAILSSLIIAMIGIACFPTAPSLSKPDSLPQMMTPGLQNMMVAPNQSKIRAKVLRINESPQFKDRWSLEIRILMIQPIKGGTFSEVGQIVQAFTIADQLPFKQNDVIAADAEYLGDSSGGLFQLTQIRVEQ